MIKALKAFNNAPNITNIDYNEQYNVRGGVIECKISKTLLGNSQTTTEGIDINNGFNSMVGYIDTNHPKDFKNNVDFKNKLVNFIAIKQ
jgi:hypothetical protein